MNKTRCPWCGKLVNKEADAKKYRQKHITVGVGAAIRHNGICSHCENIYSCLPDQTIALILLLSSLVEFLLGFCLETWALIALAHVSFGAFIVVSLITLRYRRIDSGDRHVEHSDKKLKIKMYVIKQYYNINRANIYPIFANHDERESFSTVSPVFVSKFNKKANEIEGYWLYDHCDNAYFASLDCVHLYDDDGNIVADITFKEPTEALK